MQGYHIYKKLGWLNELPADEAERVFSECSGSALWARRMAAARPFPMLERLFARARDTWTALPRGEMADAVPHPSTMSDDDLWLVVETRIARLLER